jgi:hypothetical protein
MWTKFLGIVSVDLQVMDQLPIMFILYSFSAWEKWEYDGAERQLFIDLKKGLWFGLGWADVHYYNSSEFGVSAGGCAV